MILSGSVSLEPILRQAGLSAKANIFSPFDLKPWDEATAEACLAALAKTYCLDLPLVVRTDMCRRLRCQVPHHVQQFFASLDEYLKRAVRGEASLEDVERVYTRETSALGDAWICTTKPGSGWFEGYRVALEILTEAAVHGGLLSGCSSHTDSSRGTLTRKRHHVVRDPDVLTISIGQQGPRLVEA